MQANVSLLLSPKEEERKRRKVELSQEEARQKHLAQLVEEAKKRGGFKEPVSVFEVATHLSRLSSCDLNSRRAQQIQGVDTDRLLYFARSTAYPIVNKGIRPFLRTGSNGEHVHSTAGEQEFPSTTISRFLAEVS